MSMEDAMKNMKGQLGGKSIAYSIGTSAYGNPGISTSHFTMPYKGDFAPLNSAYIEKQERDLSFKPMGKRSVVTDEWGNPQTTTTHDGRLFHAVGGMFFEADAAILDHEKKLEEEKEAYFRTIVDYFMINDLRSAQLLQMTLPEYNSLMGPTPDMANALWSKTSVGGQVYKLPDTFITTDCRTSILQVMAGSTSEKATMAAAKLKWVVMARLPIIKNSHVSEKELAHMASEVAAGKSYAPAGGIPTATAPTGS